IAKYYAAPNPELELCGPPFGKIEYGIAIEKGNVTLQQEIDSALRDLISSGELRTILSRWGLWTGTVAQALDQPPEPAAPDSEYQMFVSTVTSQGDVWSRVMNYAGAGPLLLRAAFLTLAVSASAMVLAIATGFWSPFAAFSVPSPSAGWRQRTSN